MSESSQGVSRQYDIALTMGDSAGIGPEIICRALEHLEALLSPAVPAQGCVLRDAEVFVEGVSPSNVILRVCAAYFRIWLNPVPVSRP